MPIKTNFNKWPNAITRERNFGTSNLIYHVDERKALTDPNIKTSAYTNTTADVPKRAKRRLPEKSRFGASVVANNEFKASHPETYQGFRTGVVNNELPLSFIPSEVKSYDKNAGGSAYEDTTSWVGEQENRGEKKPPKLNTQWQAPGRKIALENSPNPFPIRVNTKVHIKA